MPFTTPVPLPIVAMPVLLLVHTPPDTVLPSVVVVPAQALVVPVIAPGLVFTVTTVDAPHPVPSVYEIIVVPADTPVTTPLLLPTLATPVAPLAHTPPLVASVRVVVNPTHTLVVPPIAAGLAFTVTVATARQPVLNVYVIIVVPAVRPVTTPVETPIVATPVLPLVHVPPLVASVRVVVAPTQALSVPPMAAGLAFTVTTVVTRQPVLSE